MQHMSSTGPLLPTRLAFVVQFSAETAVGQAQFTGRVEHIVSGAVAHFRTLDELWAFMLRALTAQGSAPEKLP